LNGHKNSFMPLLVFAGLKILQQAKKFIAEHKLMY